MRLPHLRRASVFVLLAAALALAGACSSSSSGDGASAGSSGGRVTGCGIPCTTSGDCNAGLVCLPAAHGGSVCKPATCPACDAGKFCAYDTNTCEATGCTSMACGFALLGACDDCVKAKLCGTSLACANDPACKSLLVCEAGCKNAAGCIQSCRASAPPTAVSELDAYFSELNAKCPSECGASSSSGGGNDGGGSQTLPNGCSTDYPIACPNNLCCPQQYPVCGGGCGYECCAQGSGTSGGGSQSGSCPGGCGGNQVCVSFSGSGVCEPVCGSNAECQSGCCGSLQGSNLHACLPASYCSGGGTGGGNGGGGNQCQSANGCIASYGASGVCQGYIGLTNTCGKQVSCHYQLANGQTGCVLPEPGNNDCAIYAPNGVGGTINCELTDVQACVNAIGCSL